MLTKIPLLLFCLAISLLTKAQLVGGNSFMKGNFVEVGVGPCGTYGTSINAPAGYHPRGNGSFTNRLGFVADPHKDGWTVGSPNYCGDYFVPGTPEEGFGLHINGVNYNNNMLCSESSIPGSITDYKISGGNVVTTWQGQVAGIEINSTTKVPLNDVFFITEVTLKNTTASTVNNLYYMRNVDPDNEVTLPGGSYTTNNFIVAENPNAASRALVRATGLSYGCYLGLGTKDCRARVTWGGFSNRNPYNVWHGIGLSQSGSSTADIAISIAFRINSLAPGESASFKFAHVLAEADLETALDLTSPTMEVNGIPVPDNSTIEVCSGVPVSLFIANGSGFNWTWSPATGLNTTTGTNVEATVTAPATYTATGTNDCGSTTALTITLNPSLSSTIGSVGPITGPAAVCLPSPDQNYSVAPVPDATLYEWTVPVGVSIVGGDGTNQITVSFSSAFSGNITVKAKNGCGVSNTSILAVGGAAAITPSVNCPSNITVDASAGECGANVPFNATGTGAISYSHAPGSFFEVGTTTVTVTASTACGSASCSFDVTVNDAEAPQANCKPITVSLINGTASITAADVNDNSSDNCGIQSISVSTSSFNCSNAGPNSVVLSVTDVHGNTSTCATTVTVVDDEAPVANCKNVTVTLVNGVAPITAADVNDNSTDNCGIQSLSVSPSSFNCSNVGPNSVTLTVSDVNGNSSTCTATVTIVDNEAPLANCKNVTVTLFNGVAAITAADVNNNSSDACGIQTMTVSPSSFDCDDIGDHTVTLTVTDVNGNSSNCTATVTVVGAIPSCSIASTPSNNTYTGGVSTNLYLGYGPQSTTLQVSPSGGSSFTYSWGAVTGLSSTTSAAPVFTPAAQGIYTFTVTVTNEYGCSATCNITISVYDVRVPGSNNKVYLCHKTTSTNNPNQTLSVSINAVPSHILPPPLGHGDKLGQCGQTAGNASAIAVSGRPLPVDETIVNAFEAVAYPNPGTGAFILNLKTSDKAPVTIRVTDIQGRIVFYQKLLNPATAIRIGEKWQTGSYLLEVMQGDHRQTLKLTKIK